MISTCQSDVSPRPFALRPVLLLAGVAVLVLLAVAGRYGYHRDELYFLVAGDHLDWGYVDQPVFTPLIARLADTLAPGSIVALRVIPALATGFTVVTGALLARELGASRRGQVLAAGAMAGSGFVLGVGHLLSTATFDLLAWMVTLWLVARLLRSGNTRLWWVIGGVAGLALLNKHLIVLLGVAVAVGLLAERRFDVLHSRHLVGGGLLTLALAAPNLTWQARNGWPQFDMAEALAERLAVENRVTLLPLQLLFVGPLLVFLLVRGARWLAQPEARRFRPLLWAWPVGLAVAFVTAGRPYYVLPLTITVLLAGIVASESRPDGGRRLGWWVAASAVTSMPLALPLLPVARLSDGPAALANEAVVETVGWPELAEQVAGVVASLPDEERDDVVLLTGTYGEAGALERFGADHGLPAPFSPHNHYAYFRRPINDGSTVVAVRFSPGGKLDPWFKSCEVVDHVDNGLGVANEVQGQPIMVCRGLLGTWDEVWPQLRFLS